MSKTAGPRGIRYYPAIRKPDSGPDRRRAPGGPLAVYVHIPFCHKRCHFCEFAVVSGKRVTESLVEEYLCSLRQEIASFCDGAGRLPIELLQIGGGTPTSLTAPQLDELLRFLFERFETSALKEVIVEGFPSSLTEDRIAVLERVPKLKLNIGVQSFHYECLESVGREHGAQAEAAIARVVASDIKSVGVDIIFGLPASTAETVRADLERACGLGVDHFALYPLWIYDQTALDSRVRNGMVALPDSAIQRNQLHAGAEALSSRGFCRYTAFHHAISTASRHQYGLWQMLARDWIGFGMSAMSHLGGRVFFNEREVGSYMHKVQEGYSPSMSSRDLAPSDRMKFAFLYGLRLKDYPRSLFADQFGISLEAAFGSVLRDLDQRGLLICGEEAISLTLEGILSLSEIERCFNDVDSPSTPG